MKRAQGQKRPRKRQKTSNENCTLKFLPHTRSPAVFNVSASITQHLEYSKSLRHTHDKKEPRLSPATVCIEYTVIKHKHNVGSPGLLSENGHYTPNDHNGARHTHKEEFVTMFYGIDSGQSTGFISNDDFGDSRVLTEISKGA